ncbi:MAG: hypothetical protein AB7O97_04295 [Planctomycetota bacterium]
MKRTTDPHESPPRRAGSQSPEAIVAAPHLTRQQKIDLLRQLSYDARGLDVATDEGMGGGRSSELERVHDALRALGAEDLPTDAKH